MDTELSAQALETPFNMSDYVTFDFEFAVPPPTVGSSPTTGSVVECLQDMSIEEDRFNALHAASEDSTMTDDSQTSASTHASSVGSFSVFEPTNLVDPAALAILGSHSTSMPGQTWLGTNPAPCASPQLVQQQQQQPAVVAPTEDMRREPSRWTLVSPSLQVHLNEMYASQLAQLTADQSPPAALFLPVGTSSAFLTPNSTYHPVSTSNGRSISSPRRSSNKRARDVTTSDAGATPKRTRIAEGGHQRDQMISPTVFQNVDIDDETNGESVADDDNSDEDASAASNTGPVDKATPQEYHLSPPRSAAPKKKGPTWRYEDSHEARRRHQRRKQYLLHRANVRAGGAMAPNRRMQKLREEIADTREFVEARGYDVGESMRCRPVRRGARKSYAGLE